MIIILIETIKLLYLNPLFFSIDNIYDYNKFVDKNKDVYSWIEKSYYPTERKT